MGDYLEFILQTPTPYLGEKPSKNERSWLMPPVYCKDGESVSVQASETLYCMPRSNSGGWVEVECGFPTTTPPQSWIDYAEQWDRPTFRQFLNSLKHGIKSYLKYRSKFSLRNTFRRAFAEQGTTTVYGYIPVGHVQEFINEHGGEDTERCWEKYREQSHQEVV